MDAARTVKTEGHVTYKLEDGVARRFPREVRAEQKRLIAELAAKYYGTRVYVEGEGASYIKGENERILAEIKRRQAAEVTASTEPEKSEGA